MNSSKVCLIGPDKRANRRHTQIVGNPETTHFVGYLRSWWPPLSPSRRFENWVAFVLTRIVQTGEEPVKVPLRLALLDL
jgi:hypothetical protein